jgi:hypothetical protein
MYFIRDFWEWILKGEGMVVWARNVSKKLEIKGFVW